MRALIYTRVSRDPRRQGRSVEQQEQECRAVCAREGWKVVGVVKDGNRSASRHAKRRREGWAEVGERLQAGEADVLVTWECSRAQRDLGAYVKLRDLCRAHSVSWSYSGRTYDLANVNDAFSTGVDALVAEREADETQRRILRDVRANAARGRPHGRRGYGYRRVYDPATGSLLSQEPDPAEATIIREMARRTLAGESGYAITEDLNRRGVPTVTGALWDQTKVRRILTSHRIVGERVHHGEVLPGDWEPILNREDWDRLQALYSDSSRDLYRVGRDLRWLLSGIARCGKCGGRMYRGHDRHTRATYVCRDGKGHVVRDMRYTDAHVVAKVVALLENEDLNLGTLTDDPSANAARQEAAELRKLLDDATAAYTARKLSIVRLTQIESDLLPQIAAADRRSRPSGASGVAAAAMAGPKAAERWDAAPLEVKREVIATLVDIVIQPATRGRGARGFDPSSVLITRRP